MNKGEMNLRFVNLSFITFVLCLVLVPSISGQSDNLVICYEKQAYLVNGENAFSLGKCDKKNWIVPLQIEQGKATKQIKPTRRERQRLNLP